MKGSLYWHAAMAAGCAWQPQAWPWWLAGIVVDHAALTTAGLLPRCDWLGPNWRRLPGDPQRPPAIALTFDDGPDPQLTPFVLEQLARHGMRATFFCIGQRVAEHPALAREIIAAGHHIENHSNRHRHNFSLLGPTRYRQEIGAAQQRIADATGRLPQFFRAPAGLRNPLLQPVLAGLELQLAAWTRRGYDTVEGNATRVVDRLARNLAADDIVLLHDGHCADGADGVPVLHRALPALIERIGQAGLQTVRLADALPGAHSASPARAAGAIDALHS